MVIYQKYNSILIVRCVEWFAAIAKNLVHAMNVDIVGSTPVDALQDHG